MRVQIAILITIAGIASSSSEYFCKSSEQMAGVFLFKPAGFDSKAAETWVAVLSCRC